MRPILQFAVVGSSEMTAVISEGREALGGEVQQRLQEYLGKLRCWAPSRQSEP